VPKANAKRETLLQEKKFKGTVRYNFAYASDRGRVYKVGALDADRGTLDAVEVERKGMGPDYPTYVYSVIDGRWRADATTSARLQTPSSATTARKDSGVTPAVALAATPLARGPGKWTLGKGEMHIIPDTNADLAFAFDSLRDRRMSERPTDLMVTPKAPQDMGYRELGRFIKAMERSGADVNELRVERMLKLSIPVTCIVILLFGAPLATSTQRGGAAYGIGVSLGTTIVFLMLIQLMKAIGGKGLIPPDLAAWVPSAIFGVVGTYLLARVRT
jgi:lipopolysaccharide export system permease protein